MKKRSKTGCNVSKGAPSGLLISLLVHAGAFFLAGLFVVFTVLPKHEEPFVPPPLTERPKMNLKKPKVKVQKSSKPKPSSRIVAKVKTATMPEIQLPDLIGNGDGMLGEGNGFGGAFLDLPEIGEINIIGKDISSGSDMQVTYFTMARRPDGSKSSSLSEGVPEFFSLIRDFVAHGWRKSDLSGLYRSPKRLYATTLMIPPVASIIGPAAFGEDINYGYAWIALYEGKLVHKEDITFRFWGAADDILDVAVDGKVVLAANLDWDGVNAHTIAEEWVSSAPNNRTYMAGTYEKLVGGDWITLKAGVPRDFKAITGEGAGGEYYAQLLVEVQGEHYPINDFGDPLFPIFATEQPSWAVQDAILENMFSQDANVTNVTVIFNDL
ncbi:MAG: hypothetical protein JXR25_15540 [Pontiellaceae bacterium]|nr:hypothetical protein [Pontiellaceae bacterium]MBN2786233.1 hypothetical protein [Pontiellaceae bacterium]